MRLKPRDTPDVEHGSVQSHYFSNALKRYKHFVVTLARLRLNKCTRDETSYWCMMVGELSETWMYIYIHMWVYVALIPGRLKDFSRRFNLCLFKALKGICYMFPCAAQVELDCDDFRLRMLLNVPSSSQGQSKIYCLNLKVIYCLVICFSVKPGKVNTILFECLKDN